MRQEPRAIDPGIFLIPLLLPFIPAIIRTLTEPETHTFTIQVDGEEHQITITQEELEELKKAA